MLMGKEDLGLSLSLGSMENHRQRFPPPQQFDLLAASSQDAGWEYPEEAAAAATVRDIDVNRTPPLALAERESEEEAVASSPKSGISDEEDGDGSRKKLRLSKDQSAILEESFKEHSTLNPKQKLALAKQLNLRPRQVEVWFQNRRARTKLKQTEVDCEFLKRCCESLTEENRRLQKEVAELRALKLSPQLYMHMHMTPPTTLTMCPSCERVAATSAPPPDHHHHHHHQRSFAAPAPWFSMTPKTTSFM